MLSGNLNFLEPSGPLQACNGSALPLYIYTYTELSKKMDGIWNYYNLKSTRRIYTFGVLKCSVKLKFWTYLSTFQYVHRL